jgi:AmiR/NasT family two-component response regulator
LLFAVFNRCAMRGFASSVLSCLERERLEEELSEARTRGRYLSRLRHLTRREQAALDERERAAQARLMDHDAEHGCQR